jgi:hypothetical protein
LPDVEKKSAGRIWYSKLKNVRFGLATLFLVTTVAAFTAGICQSPDSAPPYGPKDIHPIVAVLFASIVVAMMSFAIAEIANCLGYGKRSELGRFRDRQFVQEVGDLDESLHQFETDLPADQRPDGDTKERKPKRRRWWARKIPNRGHSITRDLPDISKSSYKSRD